MQLSFDWLNVALYSDKPFFSVKETGVIFKLSINILNEVILVCSGVFYGMAEI